MYHTSFVGRVQCYRDSLALPWPSRPVARSKYTGWRAFHRGAINVWTMNSAWRDAPRAKGVFFSPLNLHICQNTENTDVGFLVIDTDTRYEIRDTKHQIPGAADPDPDGLYRCNHCLYHKTQTTHQSKIGGRKLKFHTARACLRHPKVSCWVSLCRLSVSYWIS